MTIKSLEQQIKNDIEYIFSEILRLNNYVLNVSSRSRSGAEISDNLENEFVSYLESNPHCRIYNPKAAPKGKTKNPYDFCFNYKTTNFDDLIWGDIKATKKSFKNSNPDLGTPEKVIKFILNGHFYIMFVFLNYSETHDGKTKFEKIDGVKYVHCQFLKDISKTVRINPKPQFQVNINEKEEYRTREEFIELFYTKYKESIDRIIKKQTEKKNELDHRFNKIREMIKKY